MGGNNLNAPKVSVLRVRIAAPATDTRTTGAIDRPSGSRWLVYGAVFDAAHWVLSSRYTSSALEAIHSRVRQTWCALLETHQSQICA